MPLSDSERAFLSRDWAWSELSDAAIKTRHPGAREADYTSPMVTEAGALLVLSIVQDLTTARNRLIVATVDGILELSFKGRPPICRLYHERFGGDKVSGQLFMVEQARVDYGARRTTLHLIG